MLSRRGILALCVALALVAVIGPEAATASPAATSAGTLVRDASLEDTLLAQINAVRAAHGLRPFAASPALARAAAGHSKSMASLGFFAHDSRDGAPFWQRVKRFYGPRTGTWTVGENLASFGGLAPSAEAIVDAWMASPAHRANLLRRLYREAGVAIVHNPSAGGVFAGRPTWVITLDLGTR